MSDLAAGQAARPVRSPCRARRLLSALIVLGLVSFAAVLWSVRQEPDECWAFQIGVSAIGGCDGIGGAPASTTPTQRFITRMAHLRYAIGQFLPESVRHD
jgi:hypothetical protein